MHLKVVFGPACAPSLRTGIVERISALMFQECPAVDVHIDNFEDGEFLAQIGSNVRGTDVYVVQPTNQPDRNFSCLLQMLQAAALGAAAKVTAVLPYCGELRGDTKDKPRVAIPAKLVADMISQAMSAAPHRQVVIMHPHFPQINGFFHGVPVDRLYPTNEMLGVTQSIVDGDISRLTPTAADAGGAKLASLYAMFLDTDALAVGDKRRPKNDRPYIRDIVGDIDGRIAMFYEDIVDTARTMMQAVMKAEEKGAIASYLAVTHPVLARGALENLRIAQQHGLKRVFTTDSICRTPEEMPDDLFTVVSVGPLIGEAIWRNFTGGSISDIAGAFLESH
ncbi:MAG: ribose-phosphate diphosphokinase [Parcubacteria group bacterium]